MSTIVAGLSIPPQEIVVTDAPGAPGVAPTWTSSAKDLVGTAAGPARLWFTIGFGIINEVYYPRVDSPQIRDLGFIVADDAGFWVEVKRNADYELSTPAPGIPAAQIIHRHPRFELRLRVAPDPERDVLLVDACLSGDPGLRLYALLAPHLGGTASDDRAEVFRNRDRTVVCAESDGYGVALAAVSPADQRDAWSRASAGYVGGSDGWQDFAHNGAMRWTYPIAGPGNVALLAETCLPEVTIALGFGPDKEAAATLAISALLQPFEQVWRKHIESWEAWQERSVAADHKDTEFDDALHVSAMVLRTHQDKTFPGAMVASLSIPWGSSNDDRGGYHLVWPRDLVESASALLALGARKEPRDILRYLIASQLADGRWSQNQWLGGQPHWQGLQLDEVALPVLLAAALAKENALEGIAVADMVRRALRFIALSGPSTEQDRWEETPGLNAFTIACAIAAMVGGAELLDPVERHDIQMLADDWNAHIEEWLVAADPHLCARHGIASYYARSVPPRIMTDPRAINDPVPVRNHAGGLELPASALIATDFLQLVRCGLRAPDDPIIKDTVRLVDAMLKAETPSGPAWYRYNEDGYGEHEDGRAFDGSGKGRPWPLLAGERAHFEIAAGNLDEARTLARAMLAMTGRGLLLPEQIWDDAAVPLLNLFPGRPSGSAMPLVWAHGELVKLILSLGRERPVDRPEAAWLRYGGKRPEAVVAHWSLAMPVGSVRHGQAIRFLFENPAVVHWQAIGGAAVGELHTRSGMLGLQVADIGGENLREANGLRFSATDLASGVALTAEATTIRLV